jgi:putative ABC transport system permease protein
MKIKDSFFYAIRNLQTSSLRSWLTIIGVVIGVIALVAITSVSEGVQKTVYDELAAFGPNMMIVVPVNMDKMNIQGAMSSVGRPATSGKLFERDAAAIAGIPGVKSVARMNMGRTSVSFLDVALTSPIYGSDASYYDQYKGYLKLESGRMFKDGERRVVVLGNDAANKMFGKRKVDVGNVIKINDQDYRVIGIFEKIGSSF